MLTESVGMLNAQWTQKCKNLVTVFHIYVFVFPVCENYQQLLNFRIIGKIL